MAKKTTRRKLKAREILIDTCFPDDTSKERLVDALEDIHRRSTQKAGPPSSEKQVLPGGTTRSEKAPPFHLVPPEGPRRIAHRFGLGAENHGEDNWKLCLTTEEGRREFVRTAINHLQEHVYRLVAEEDVEDDHLGAIGWTVYALAYVEARYGKTADLKRL